MVSTSSAPFASPGSSRTEFVPDNALVRFFLRRVTFRMEPEGAQTRFTQEIEIRIGPIGRALNRKGFKAVERHMREEGENLKALMEAGAM